MELDIKEIDGACHCGTVRFRVKLTDGFKTARRCTCSYCRMRGAVAVSADIGGISFQAGEEALTLYRFNTGVAQHYFCSKCGIYTHHRRRSNPNQYGVNVACLKGMSRRHAYYKMVSLVLGTIMVRNELGLPEAQCLAADERYSLVVPIK